MTNKNDSLTSEHDEQVSNEIIGKKDDNKALSTDQKGQKGNIREEDKYLEKSIHVQHTNHEQETNHMDREKERENLRFDKDIDLKTDKRERNPEKGINEKYDKGSFKISTNSAIIEATSHQSVKDMARSISAKHRQENENDDNHRIGAKEDSSADSAQAEEIETYVDDRESDDSM